MRLVELTRDLRPWRAGDSALVPQDIAERMVASGEATNMRPYPETVASTPPPAPPRRVGYLTRKG